MPKTAGTSFSDALKLHFGDRYRADYADLPMHATPLRRNLRAMVDRVRRYRRLPAGVGCVHGHFLPTKYRLAAARRDACFVTWLRDPVERVVSHYHFWRRDYHGEDPAQPLRNRMLREDWSLERFALGPEVRNLYSQYLWRFDPRRFDFIGITEHYAEDLDVFAHRFLGGPAPLSCALANPERAEDQYLLEPALRSRIASHHAADVALYRWALLRRNAV